MQTEELIGVAELAKRLNVPVSWIYQRTRLGPKAIPHVKMGKYVRFNPAEVVEFFRNHPPARERLKRLAKVGIYGTIHPWFDGASNHPARPGRPERRAGERVEGLQLSLFNLV